MKSLDKVTVFSTLDANCVYLQVEIEDEDQDKTVIKSHHGLHRFVLLTFGLKNAPGTFQRTMEVILAGVEGQYAAAYLDDIVIFSKVLEKHIDYVKQLLTLLPRAGVTLKLKKFSSFTDSIEYFRQIIRL